ncbi:unnamed protein product [Polarella glacialis]|uniref:Glycosyl transferase family 1 domain-containing protein n=1 Tax=Polarella glacialis TaxID=89957 RepID=A0A813HAQ6_POLGL|nr:unnamed protein product [Polarella glacialis]
MPHLCRAADAFVLPSRGEGGRARPVLGAMAMGLPVIATRKEVPSPLRLCCVYGLNSSLEAVPLDGDFGDFALPGQKPQPLGSGIIGHRWHAPSVAHLSQLMQHVVSHGDEAQNIGEAARREVLRRYSEKAVARRLAVRAAGIALRQNATTRRLHKEWNSQGWLAEVRAASRSFLGHIEQANLARQLVDIPEQVRAAYADGWDRELYDRWLDLNLLSGQHLAVEAGFPAATIAELSRCVAACECNEIIEPGVGQESENCARSCSDAGFPAPAGGEIGRGAEMGRAVWCAAHHLGGLGSGASILELFAKDGGGTTLLAADGLTRALADRSPGGDRDVALFVTFEANITRAVSARDTLGYTFASKGGVALLDVRRIALQTASLTKA